MKTGAYNSGETARYFDEFGLGDLIPEHLPRRGNAMHLFRSAELRAWLEAAGVELLDLSACFCLSPGCLDMGTHIIAAARKA